jgi:hypothetical protein
MTLVLLFSAQKNIRMTLHHSCTINEAATFLDEASTLGAMGEVKTKAKTKATLTTKATTKYREPSPSVALRGRMKDRMALRSG